MINRMRMAGLAGALLGLVVSAAVADDLETVEKRICTAWAKHRSATATIAMQSEFTSDEHHMTSNGQGTYEFLRQGDKLLARTEMRSTMTQRVGEQEMSSQQQVLVVVDGQWAHTYAETTWSLAARRCRRSAWRPSAIFPAKRRPTRARCWRICTRITA